MKTRIAALLLILTALTATGCGKQMRDYIGGIPSEDLLTPPGGSLNPFSEESKSVRVSSGYGVAVSPSASVTVAIGHASQTVANGTTTDALVRLSQQRMQ